MKKFIYQIKCYKQFFSLLIKEIDTSNWISINSENKNKKILEKTRNLLNNNKVFGFDIKNKQDYLLEAILNNYSTEDLFNLKEQIEKSYTPPYQWDTPVKSFFNTIDLSIFCKLGSNIYEINSYLNTDITFPEIEEYIDDSFSKKEKDVIINSVKREVFLIENIYNNNEIQSLLKIKEQIINDYLPGKDYLLSQRDSKLGEMILTNNYKDNINQKSKFDWFINGNNALLKIPTNWKDELVNYQQKCELVFEQYKNKECDISKLKEITTQFPNIKLSNNLIFKPSLGGGHSKRTEKIIRRKNVYHYDIEGAYGTVINLRGSFGNSKLNYKYNQFLKRKFDGKQAKKYFNKYKETKDIVKLRNDLLDRFNFRFMETNNIKELSDNIDIIVRSTKTLPNIISGLLDSQFSKLYNPIAMIENRLILQMALYDASNSILKVGNTDILSINTDGLFFTTDDIDAVELELKKWTEFWGIDFGREKIDEYIAKDDNNRLLIHNGVIIEASGDDLSHKNLSILKLGTKPRIVDYVLSEKLKNPNISIKEMVRLACKANRVDLFIWCTKATKKHKLVINNMITQPVHRFLLTKHSDRIGNYNLETDKIDKILHLPSEAYISIFKKGFPEKFPDNLDIESYINLINNVYEKWQ
jgi:hypothetical protein